MPTAAPEPKGINVTGDISASASRLASGGVVALQPGLNHCLRQAMDEFLNSSSNASLLERFRESYEYRKSMPWLREANPELGLVFAVGDALRLLRADPKESMQAKGVSLDYKFREALRHSAHKALESGIVRDWFVNDIRRYDKDSSLMNVDQLGRYFNVAFRNYCRLSRSDIQPEF